MHVLLHVPLHVLLHVLHVPLLLGRYIPVHLLVAAAGSGKGPAHPFLYQLMAVECVCMHAVAAGEIPFNELCFPLIRWLGGLPICKLLVQ